jgi:hypothetical protein
MTLGVHFPPDTGTRSAVYVEIDSRHFVITASHLLEKDKIKEVWAVPRPQSPITQVSNPKTSPVPTLKPGRQFQLPIQGMRYEADPLDLLVMRVKPLQDQGGYLRSFKLADSSPSALRGGQHVQIIGFPEDYYISLQKGPNTGLQRRLSMYLHMTERAKEPKSTILGYNRKLHILLNLDSTRFGPMKVDPKGLSGGSAWRMKIARRVSEIWTPSSADLLGIQTGCYRGAKLLKITRIDEAIRLAREIP